MAKRTKELTSIVAKNDTREDLHSVNTGEIVLYQLDNSITLEVRIEEETVWLTQAQMSDLFQKDRTTITRHINNVFSEGELEKDGNVHFLHFPFSDKPVMIYNLDVIISVGYRVKSQRGTNFRKWANKVLKEYLLRGFAINRRIENLEQRVGKTEEKIDFFVRTSLPPVEGVFYDGQVFDAYKFVSDLIRSAQSHVILFDNYVDDTVLTLLDKRKDNVSAIIYTRTITRQFALDLQRHNTQYGTVDVNEFQNVHDRFLCIDDIVYHFGASLKDLGKKWFAFSRMEISTDVLLAKI